MKFKLSFWRVLFIVIMGLGLYSTFIRFFYGLGAATNMSDQFPWGLWIGFDLLCGVMLAAGGFCIVGAVYLFNVESLHSVVRPAVLTAFLGYVLFIVGLLFDLGRPWYIWHQLIYMNPRSVMFEVGICVMSYTTVLFFEFLPNVFERFNMQTPIKWIKKVYPVLIILGILLSTLHQSSLGSLYLIMPSKLHPFWYTPALPFFFFGSAIAVGLAMTIFESTQSAKAFGRHLELPVLVELGGALLVALWVNALLRFEDYFHRGLLGQIIKPSYEAYFLWLELALAFLARFAIELLQRHPFPFGCGLHHLRIQRMQVAIVRDMELNRRARPIAIEHVVDSAFDIHDQRHFHHHQVEFFAQVVFDITLHLKDGLLGLFRGQ